MGNKESSGILSVAGRQPTARWFFCARICTIIGTSWPGFGGNESDESAPNETPDGARPLPFDSQFVRHTHHRLDQSLHVPLGVGRRAGDPQEVLRGRRAQHGVNVDALFE